MNPDQAPVAPCAGKWFLFDSTDINDHKEAKALCHDCPIFNTCEQLMHAELTKVDSKYGGGPRGTWAGRLITRPATADDRTPPVNPAAEEHMFTDAEALAAQNAYQRGDRSDRAVVGKRVYARRSKNRDLVTRALHMRARGWTTAEAANELGTTQEALQKAIERAARAVELTHTGRTGRVA